MAIYVLPIADGDCPILVCEGTGVCYRGDLRADIDPPELKWNTSIPGLGDIFANSGYRLGLDFRPIP